MSDNTRTLIRQYFQSLVDEFIKDPAHKDITIVFKDCIEKSLHGDTLGLTECERTGGTEHWQTENGVEVPGSRWKEPFKYTYTVSFLNHYEDSQRWRGTVAHEFAHLYLFTKSDEKHYHDNIFYEKMDYFEEWLDNKWNLSPRQDKGGDWNQHVDYDKRKQREEQYPSQSKDDDNYSPPPLRYKDTPEGKAESEELRLCDLIRNSKTLTELENNWQTIKNSSLYLTGGKEKEWLDTSYSISKRSFCSSCSNKKREHKSNCPNKCSKCSDSRLWSDSKMCHNINCENYCYNPKWDRERKLEEQKRAKRDSEQKEFNHLVDALRNSKNLNELEKIWKEIKNSSVYSNSKYNWKDKSLSNKSGLDYEYSNCKNKFQDSSDTKCSECQKSINGTTYHFNSKQLCKECYDRKRDNFKQSPEPISWTPVIIGSIIVGIIILVICILALQKKKRRRKWNKFQKIRWQN